MALTFDYINELDTGAQPHIAHEKDSKIYNYYIELDRALDKHVIVELGEYDNVSFGDVVQRSLTTRAVSRIGVKNFPGIGGIGFYRDAFSDASAILAPIHTNITKYDAPMLTKAEILDGKLHVVITPPSTMNYNCYRIVARQNAFAFEYITYKTDYSVDLPTVKGNYEVYCIGYDEENGTISEDSNSISLTIESGTDDWAPHFEDYSDMIQRIENLESDMGDIGAILDDINGVEV